MEKFSGCPGSKMMDLSKSDSSDIKDVGKGSELRQWPIQLHLVSPAAPYYEGSDVVLAADCVAFAHPDFHQKFLKGKSIAIACPKLDEEQEIYVEKIITLIDEANINTLSVLIMEVPCCSGLFHLAKEAADKATRKVPVKKIVISLKGEVISEEWV